MLTRRSLFLALITLLFLLPGCAARRDNALNQTLERAPAFFLPGGAALTDEQFTARLGAADFILVGERHNSPADHLAQVRVLELAARNEPRPLVGLEMLPRQRYDAELAAFLTGKTCLEYLPTALNWDREWGFAFELYAPIFAKARDLQLPLHGLNIDHALRKKAGQKGIAALSAREKELLPNPVALPLPEQRDMLARVFAAHAPGGAARPGEKGAPPRMPIVVPGTRGGEERPVVVPLSLAKPFERFLLVQSLWDSAMAEQALRLRQATGRPVAVLAGSAHVEGGLGIAYRLRLLDPKARILLIMPASGPASEARGADVFFPVPEASRRGFGLAFEQKEGKLIVASVRPGSAAEKAGARPGDAVLAADGRTVSGPAALHQAALLAARAQKALRLSLQRGDKMLEVTLPPR